jgi:hypothetical protein
MQWPPVLIIEPFVMGSIYHAWPAFQPQKCGHFVCVRDYLGLFALGDGFLCFIAWVTSSQILMWWFHWFVTAARGHFCFKQHPSEMRAVDVSLQVARAYSVFVHFDIPWRNKTLNQVIKATNTSLQLSRESGTCFGFTMQITKFELNKINSEERWFQEINAFEIM